MSRKGENIYKRKDGRWEARYIQRYENGKAVYRYLYGKSYKEVRAKKNAALSTLDNLRISYEKASAQIDQICCCWLKSKKVTLKESSFARYKRITERYIIPCFQNQPVSKIDNSAIEQFYYSLKGTLSDKTVSDIFCVFRSVWYFGTEHGYPCCRIASSHEKLKKNKTISVIPPETRKKLETALLNEPNLLSLGILFTLFTGVRIGEICGLRWGDIDFENGCVFIQRTVERMPDLDGNTGKKTKIVISKPKTENSVRIIPLPSFLLNYLQNFKEDDDKYFLTASEKHTEPHTYYTRYKNFLRKYKIGDYTFHELRHTFATECVEKGFDIKSLSEILGHADVSTTMKFYVHPTIQMKKRQMEKLSLTVNSPSA